MKFRIEKGIKLTGSQERRRQDKYPFKQMKVGDSFIVSRKYSRNEMSCKSSAARNWKNKTRRRSWKFACRRTKDNKIRIWRIK